MRAQCQEERKTELSKAVKVLTAILTGTHFWELVLQDWKPSHQSGKNCVCLTSLYPLLKKEQGCQYTTQGSRLKCYSISPRYKIYQSFVLYFAFYIFQNKMKIHTYSLERYLEIDETNSIKLPNCPWLYIWQ